MSQSGFKDDFFDGQPPDQKGKRAPFLDKYGEQRYLPQVKVPIEYTAIIAIVMLIAIIVAYAIGVERGKTVALIELERAPLNNAADASENEPVIDVEMVERQAQELMKRAETPEPPLAPPVQPANEDAVKTLKEASQKNAATDKAVVRPVLPAKQAASGKLQPSAQNSAVTVPTQFSDTVLPQTAAAERYVYTLQLASSKNEEYANLELMKMKAKGIEASMTKKGDWFKIFTSYPTLEEAEKAKKKLSGDYKDCLIVKTKQ